MNLSALNGIRTSAAAFWAERNTRERNLLTLGTTAIVLALIYLLFIDPALSGRTQLDKALPQLRQQAAELQTLTRRATELAAVKAPPAVALTKESLEAALARQSLKAQSVVVTGEVAKVQLSSVSFSALVNWLDDMRKTARLSVTDANIESLTAVDTVNATLTLRQQRSEKEIN